MLIGFWFAVWVSTNKRLADFMLIGHWLYETDRRLVTDIADWVGFDWHPKKWLADRIIIMMIFDWLLVS